MRYLTTLLFAALSLNAFSQNNAIYLYPWNPDANQDNSIGMGDLLSFLSVFGNEFGLPPEPCTYDGTALEELLAGVTNGDIILDSLFIEYELEDSSTYYEMGCPDPITETVIFSNSVLLDYFYEQGYSWTLTGNDAYGDYHSFRFNLNFAEGLYSFGSRADILADYEAQGFFGGDNCNSENYSIPFPEEWFLDDNGIHIDYGWSQNCWPYYANYMHILPYWHYADE